MNVSKKLAKRLVCLLLVMVSSLLPVISVEARYNTNPENWETGVYNSDLGRYVANIAQAQYTKKGEDLGYTVDWCAMFVMDCGERAGTTALNPPLPGNAYTPDYYNNLLASGGWVVSRWEAKAGDIAFFDMNGHDGIDHVEIVYDIRVIDNEPVVYTVGGNTGNPDPRYSYVNKRTTPGSARDVQNKIYKIVRPNYPAIINGEFYIRSTVGSYENSFKVLDIYYGRDSNRYAKNVQLCGFHGGDNQKFRIIHMGDGWHRIQSVQPSSKSLDVEGNYSISGTNVIVWGNHDGDNQRWRFIPDGSGFRIQSKLGFYLDVSGGSSDDETNVQVWDGNGTSAQLWQLYKTSDGRPYGPYWLI